MEISHNTEAQSLNTTAYPESVNETKSAINPQALLWALIAIVLFAIYYQQLHKNHPFGIKIAYHLIVPRFLCIVK